MARLLSEGELIDSWLGKEPEILIAAFCPTCGGFTMFVTSGSQSARSWIQQCYVAGDLIMPVRSPISMGPSCPQVETLLADRTCDR